MKWFDNLLSFLRASGDIAWFLFIVLLCSTVLGIIIHFVHTKP